MILLFKKFRSWLKENLIVKFLLELFLIILPIVFLTRTLLFGLYQVPSGSMETTLLVGERFFADKLTPWFTDIKKGDIIAFNDPTYEYSKNYFKNFYQRYLDWNVSNWTKRVIGLPGDRIKGRIEQGRPVVYLNDLVLNEPYINKYPLIIISKDNDSNEGVLAGPGIELRSFVPSMPYNKQPFYDINVNKIAKWLTPTIPFLIYPNTPADQGIDFYDRVLDKDEYWVMGDNRLNSSDSRVWGVLNKKLIHGKILFRILSIDTQESWILIDLIKNPISFWKKIRWSRCFETVK